MSTVLLGQDSVSPGGMRSGLSVYAGYGRGSFTNISTVESRFPGRKYVSIATSLGTGVDCYDIESGGGSASEAPTFFRQWRKLNTVKPVFYASRSQIGSVESYLSGAGIPRSAYFLWVASWNGSSAIPGGFDAHQYANASGYDSDSFYDYLWDGHAGPVSVFPLQAGTADPAATKVLQENLNRWSSVLKFKPLAVDSSYGPVTASAVIKAQVFFSERGIPAGECTENVFSKLKGTPVPVPPVALQLCSEVQGLKLDAEGPHSFKIEFKLPTGSKVTPVDFEVAICQGSHLGPVIPSYPRFIPSKGAGSYSVQYGGVDTTKNSYLIAVRTQGAGGQNSSHWATVQLPKK